MFCNLRGWNAEILYVLSPIDTLNVCERLSSKLLRVFRLIDRVKKGLHSNNLPRDPSILLLSAGRHKSFTNRASWKPQQQSLRFYNQQQGRYGLYLGPFCSESLPQPVFQNRGNCNQRHRFCLEASTARRSSHAQDCWRDCNC